MAEMLIQNDPDYLERKWGSYFQFTKNENSTVNVLNVNKGGILTKRFHYNYSVHWFLISGRCWFTKGIICGNLMPGENVTIEKHENHSLEALDDSIVLEICKGYYDEKDIVRL